MEMILVNKDVRGRSTFPLYAPYNAGPKKLAEEAIK
jgi:hypothetical protein